MQYQNKRGARKPKKPAVRSVLTHLFSSHRSKARPGEQQPLHSVSPDTLMPGTHGPSLWAEAFFDLEYLRVFKIQGLQHRHQIVGLLSYRHPKKEPLIHRTDTKHVPVAPWPKPLSKAGKSPVRDPAHEKIHPARLAPLRSQHKDELYLLSSSTT